MEVVPKEDVRVVKRRSPKRKERKPEKAKPTSTVSKPVPENEKKNQDEVSLTPEEKEMLAVLPQQEDFPRPSEDVLSCGGRQYPHESRQ